MRGSNATLKEAGIAKQTDDIDEALGRRLSAVRRLRGLTLEGLGQLIGVSGEQVRKYEAAEDRMAAATLFRASQALAMPIHFFFADLTGPPVGQVAEEASVFRRPPRPQDVLARFVAAQPALRRRVLGAMRRELDAEDTDAPALR